MKIFTRSIVLLAMATNTIAATLYVSLTGSDTPPYDTWAKASTTIQAAVDAASSGDSVVVNEGTYDVGYPPTPGHSSSNRVVITKSITVSSLGGAANTIISGKHFPFRRGDKLVRCVYMTGGELIGFTLQNGYATTESGSILNRCGGGAFLNGGGTIRNCIIQNNTASWDGGGVMGGTLENCTLSDNVTSNMGGGSCYSDLINCTITGNAATNGGGSAYGTLEDCTFSGNVAASYGGGCYYGTLANSTLSDNSAYYGGGSAYTDLTDCTISLNEANRGGGVRYGAILNCTFDQNNATNSGGAAYQADLINCILSENTANNAAGASSSTLDGCTLENNIATGTGGGSANSTLNDCTLDGNRADRGAGVYGGTLTNCTLTENIATIHGGGSAYATLTGCTLIDNDGGGAGGGSYFDTLNRCILSGNTASKGGGAYDGTLHNTIFIDNTAIWGGGCYNSELDHCTLKANSAVNHGGGCHGGTLYNSIVVDNLSDTNEDGNGSGDDLFGMDSVIACCTPVLETGQSGTTNAPNFDYLSLRLRSDSPCIDSAVTQSGTITTDIDGLPRWLDGDGNGTAIADMGAYEFAGSGNFDNDGLTDAEEVALGSGVNNDDSDGDGRTDGVEVATGFSPTFDESAAIAQGEANVTDDPAAHGLYTADSIQDLNMGHLMVQSSNSVMQLSLQLKQTDNLASNVWNEVGDAVEWTIPATNGAAFFRVHAQ